MLKNIVISILAAVLIMEKVPWFAACALGEKIGIFIGICIPLIIFCLFCQEMAEKWRKYRARVRKIEEKLENMRSWKPW